jgi:hypothetical protein
MVQIQCLEIDSYSMYQTVGALQKESNESSYISFFPLAPCYYGCDWFPKLESLYERQMQVGRNQVHGSCRCYSELGKWQPELQCQLGMQDGLHTNLQIG